MGQEVSKLRNRGRSVDILPRTNTAVVDNNSIQNVSVGTQIPQQNLKNYHSQPNTMVPQGHILNLLLPPPDKMEEHNNFSLNRSKLRSVSANKPEILNGDQILKYSLRRSKKRQLNSAISFCEAFLTLKRAEIPTLSLQGGPLLGYGLENTSQSIISTQRSIRGRMSFAPDTPFLEEFRKIVEDYNTITDQFSLQEIINQPKLKGGKTSTPIKAVNPQRAERFLGREALPDSFQNKKIVESEAKIKERRLSQKGQQPQNFDYDLLNKLLHKSPENESVKGNKQGIIIHQNISKTRSSQKGTDAEFSRVSQQGMSPNITKQIIHNPPRISMNNGGIQTRPYNIQEKQKEDIDLISRSSEKKYPITFTPIKIEIPTKFDENLPDLKLVAINENPSVLEESNKFKEVIEERSLQTKKTSNTKTNKEIDSPKEKEKMLQEKKSTGKKNAKSPLKSPLKSLRKKKKQEEEEDSFNLESILEAKRKEFEKFKEERILQEIQIEENRDDNKALSQNNRNEGKQTENKSPDNQSINTSKRNQDTQSDMKKELRTYTIPSKQNHNTQQVSQTTRSKTGKKEEKENDPYTANTYSKPDKRAKNFERGREKKVLHSSPQVGDDHIPIKRFDLSAKRTKKGSLLQNQSKRENTRENILYLPSGSEGGTFLEESSDMQKISKREILPQENEPQILEATIDLSAYVLQPQNNELEDSILSKQETVPKKKIQNYFSNQRKLAKAREEELNVAPKIDQGSIGNLKTLENNMSFEDRQKPSEESRGELPENVQKHTRLNLLEYSESSQEIDDHELILEVRKKLKDLSSKIETDLQHKGTKSPQAKDLYQKIDQYYYEGSPTLQLKKDVENSLRKEHDNSQEYDRNFFPSVKLVKSTFHTAIEGTSDADFGRQDQFRTFSQNLWPGISENQFTDSAIFGRK